ncbi:MULTISPECIES: hypothetical protein [unclassified Streptomyces]|uniref:hypothetical protein n=1 Tax=unclassified Streptomyces TaxID=2593676 RepID=UPI00099F33D0|nr:MULTISPECIES: hypothetical protein [unclassified Streptomyces]
MVRRRVPLATLALVACALAAGGLWWWAVLRLVLVPGESGPVEGAVAAGGWGLSLLPVHVAASSGRARVRAGARTGGRSLAGAPGRAVDGVRITRASRRRRWGGGSGRS